MRMYLLCGLIRFVFFTCWEAEKSAYAVSFAYHKREAQLRLAICIANAVQKEETEMELKKHIFLIGFMGVGKTSTSRQLSQKMNVGETDTDERIVRQEGKSIAEIFADSGEEAFREMETPCIVSCGGGMAMRGENVRRMKESGTVVFLTASPETIYSHVKDSTDRPLLNGNMNVPYIRRLMEERTPKYQAAADMIIETDGLDPEQVADKIMKSLEKKPDMR